MKGQFLCTFTSNDSLSLTVDYLSTYYKIYNNKFYMYTDRDNPYSSVLVYNTEDNLRDGLAKNTISINKKKHTNHEIHQKHTMAETKELFPAPVRPTTPTFSPPWGKRRRRK